MDPSNNRRVGRPRQSDHELNPLVTLTAEERRDVFLDTAARLFEEHGYASTSIEDITEALGLSKAIFYYYWKNKKDILLEIHNRAVQALNDHLSQVLTDTSDPIERLTGLIKGHLQVVMNRRSLVAVLLGEATYSDETLQARRDYTNRFQRVIEEAIHAGVVDSNYPPKILTYALLGLLNSTAQWYRPDGEMSSKEIASWYLQLATVGCLHRSPSRPN